MIESPNRLILIRYTPCEDNRNDNKITAIRYQYLFICTCISSLLWGPNLVCQTAVHQHLEQIGFHLKNDKFSKYISWLKCDQSTWRSPFVSVPEYGLRLVSSHKINAMHMGENNLSQQCNHTDSESVIF